jgi:pimeloyl-ACP methyl ester carboxylesterase
MQRRTRFFSASRSCSGLPRGDYLRELAGYWHSGFDWKIHERRWNQLPHFRTEIDGLDIHFIHIRGHGRNPLPLVLTHGWPSSFLEYGKIIPLLTDPQATGGRTEDAFDVIIPSLPGYGFSARPAEVGMTKARIAKIWAELMSERLGYRTFCAHGGEIESGVTNQLGLNHAGKVLGFHVMAVARPWLGLGSAPLTAEELRYQATLSDWDRSEAGYCHMHRSRPQTLGYSLADSPAGLAAWIVEKLRNWSDCGGNIAARFSKEEISAILTLYWATETITSSMRLYYDDTHFQPLPGPDTLITALSTIALTTEAVSRAPRSWAKRTYTNLQRWTEFPKGGHFMAHEEPAMLAGDLREFFRPFR